MPDWDEMCRIEPMLLDIEYLAKILGTDYKYENYESVKKRLSYYVGDRATKPELRGPGAWEIAMRHTAELCAP